MSWLQNSYASRLSDKFFTEQAPQPASHPQLAIYNELLANELGIAEQLSDEQKAVTYLSGNTLVSESKPISQAYAGHQFGHFTKLGDGRAVLLGEIKTEKGRYDLQLKGSGQTPYSRGGDGRATYYSMLREYLMSEAIHALNIPTTRSLAVVKTGDKVYREQANEGAVLSRVAASHIRVGTFEYARYFGEPSDLEDLLLYTIERHYPELLDHPNHALALLEKVMHQQKDLIVNWLRVGFIHGVMNTDNMAVSGETIDYGPCAFMNNYHPSTVFSSIDTQGRYAFANQPNMAYWNLSVFVNALMPLIDADEKVAESKISGVLDQFPGEFSKAYYQMMCHKLGIVNPVQEDNQLVQEGLVLLANNEIDYTNFFTQLRLGGELIDQLMKVEDFRAWHARWEQARSRDTSLSISKALMVENNPMVIPRNHMVEQVLDSAISGDIAPLFAFLDELSSPYDQNQSPQMIPDNVDVGYKTFCGT